MKMNYLNLRSLRNQVLNRHVAEPTLAGANSPKEVVQLLSSSGIKHAFANIPQENFELLQQDDAVCFAVDGIVKWEINAHHFTGDPQVSARIQGDYIDLFLRNAFYPGTCIPADMHCCIYKGIYHWEMDIKLLCGTTINSVPFMQWLAGNRTIKTLIEVNNTTILHLNSTKTLLLDGIAKIELNSQWELKLKGKNIIRLTGFANILEADKLVIRLNTSRLSQVPLVHSSSISVYRGDKNWQVLPQFQFPEGQHLIDTSTTFDVLTIESGIDYEDNCVQLMLVESQQFAQLNFLPSPDHSQQEETLFEKVCYAVEFEDEDEKFVLFATNGCNTIAADLLVLDSPIDMEMRQEVNFEINGMNDFVEIVHYAPVLPRVTVVEKTKVYKKTTFNI